MVNSTVAKRTDSYLKGYPVTFHPNHRTSRTKKFFLIFFVFSLLISCTLILIHYSSIHYLDKKQTFSLNQIKFLAFTSSNVNQNKFSSELKEIESQIDLNDNKNHVSYNKNRKTNNQNSTISNLNSSKNQKLKKSHLNSNLNKIKKLHENNNSNSINLHSYFKSENSHHHPNRVRKTDIQNKKLNEIFLEIPGFSTLKGLKISEFGNKIFKFLSIPYAKPPIGELRFSEPKEIYFDNDTILDNTKFGAICPQYFDDVLVKTVTPLTRNMSEDCLTLNIWTPKLPSDNKSHLKIINQDLNLKNSTNLWTILSEDALDFEDDNITSINKRKKRSIKKQELLPVMVWIHGGSFSIGSAALDEYDGQVLSSYGNVIVVTINYRLGLFGFFNLNMEQVSGNQGFKDQLMALKWVKKYIKYFGGDPERITLFGQSAGGIAIGLHMISPNAKNLFKRVILQSGSPLVFDQFYSKTLNISRRIAQNVNCTLEDEEEDSDENENENENEGITEGYGPNSTYSSQSSNKNESDEIKEENSNKSSTSNENESRISKREYIVFINKENNEKETEKDELTTNQIFSLTSMNSSESTTLPSSETSLEKKKNKNLGLESLSDKSTSETESISSITTSSLPTQKNVRLNKNEKFDFKSKEMNVIKCLRSKTMKSLIRAQKYLMQQSMFPFSPNKDNSILPKMPAEIIKHDLSSIYFHQNVEQVLLGINKDEGSLYLHLTMPNLFPSENITLNLNRLSDLRAMLVTNLTNAFKVPKTQATVVANILLSNGPEIDTTDNLVRKYYQLIADLMFNCPTVMLADELVKLDYQTNNVHKKQVYFYRFNERPSVTNWGEWMGITHHEEVQFVFGMPIKYPLKYNSKDLLFSKRIMKTWAYFAETGKMLPQLDLEWPAYNKQQQLMELNAFESKLTEKLHERNCNLFRIGFESFMRRRKRSL